jgi:hypothetical protein
MYGRQGAEKRQMRVPYGPGRDRRQMRGDSDPARTDDQSLPDGAAMTEHRIYRADAMRFASPTGDI